MADKTTTTTSSGGVGLSGLLFITFLVLKLTGVIDWSWWWVTAPLWGSVALVVLILLGIGAVALVLMLLANRREKRLGIRGVRRVR